MTLDQALFLLGCLADTVRAQQQVIDALTAAQTDHPEED